MNFTKLALSILALIHVFGCNSQSDISESKDRELTMLAFDNSGSTEVIRKQLLSASHDLGTELDGSRSNFILFRFGSKVEEIFCGLPEDEDSFALLLSRAVKDSDPVRGTNYSMMLRELAARANSSIEERITIVIAGDGFNDFKGDVKLAHMYRKAATSLAENPKVLSIRFWGVQIGAREEIRLMFKGFDTKLQIRSIDQSISE